jgi:asparagine synthase (glutamine-hydrolysing)
MSRIAGIVGFSATAPAAPWLAAMTAAQSGEGWQQRAVSAPGATMAWTGWREPVAHSDHGLIAVVDGSVYNRADFAASTSAAELLCRLYRSHGFAGALQRINGDFAAALYDSGQATLWLGRDRFGFKPLYYTTTADGFAFASRPGALLTLPGVSREPNRQFVAIFAASHYRYFDNQPHRSPYEAIQQLPAGSVLEYRSSEARVSRYWDLAPEPFAEPNEARLADEYRDLLLDAVRLRLSAADRPAFTLSGGMDSSSVLASAVHVLGGKQDAYSVVYDDKEYDESTEITTMLDSSVSRWHRVPIGTPDVSALVDRMVGLHDEPVATATWLSHHLLCDRVKADGFSALFGGLGGDELNAGEYEYFFYFFADLAAAGRVDDLNRETAKWVEYHDHPIFKKSPAVMQDGLKRLVDLTRPGVNKPDRVRMLRYRDALEPSYFDLEAFHPDMSAPFTSYLHNRAFQDLFRETAPCCLRAEDRQATAAGIDHFLPFLDHRLVEFMFRVPGTMKFRDGVTKYLLRNATRGLLPEDTRTRIKKTGWNAPAHVWFSGAGADELRDIVASQRFRERGIYRPEVVSRLIDEHEAIVQGGRTAENHMMFLWQLLNLELWLRRVEAR